MKRPVVAIDGPAGAGKSTVTRLVAATLGYVMVDTGALYRAIALAAKQAGASFDDEAAVGVLAERLASERAIELGSDENGGTRVLLAGSDVSQAIRTLEMGQGASKVSAQPRVRSALLAMQRDAGRNGGVVLEGRDIGTVVFPEAEAKFFLTASVDVRARRRFDELALKGTDADLDEVKREVEERDRRDSTRPIAPLRRADDAMVVDSSNLEVSEVVEAIVARVRAIEAALNAP
ncbi:MAG TPA: (d)CMP kinase [Polyangiaceae bacterium]|nr:(d)CMP kinase [Polyangiaceae bacterium]